MERPAKAAFRAGLMFAFLLVGLALLSYGAGVFSNDLYVFPATADDPAWWQRAIPVAIVLAAIAAAVYTAFFFALGRRPYAPLWVVLCALLLFRVGHAIVVGSVSGSYTHCPNCSNHLKWVLHRYAERDWEGRLPHGGRDEWDSLAKIATDEYPVHNVAHLVAHHALGPRTLDQWERTGTLSADVCSYRYNEGLRIGDPEGMVVLFFKYPSGGMCSSTRRGPLGRCCFVIVNSDGDLDWSFLDEAAFQEAQRRTEDFIQRRIERQPEIEALQADLSVTLTGESPSPLRRRYRSSITNRGGMELGITFLRGTGYLFNPTNNYMKSRALPRMEEIRLRPGESFEFPWWFETEIDRGSSRKVVSVKLKKEDHSVIWLVDRPGMPVEVGREKESWVEACVWLRVQREGRPDIEVRVRSPRTSYLPPE